MRLLARARARTEPEYLRAAATSAWHHRWTGVLAVAAQRAFAASLLELPLAHLCVDGDPPPRGELLGGPRESLEQAPRPSRLPAPAR